MTFLKMCNTYATINARVATYDRLEAFEWLVSSSNQRRAVRERSLVAPRALVLEKNCSVPLRGPG